MKKQAHRQYATQIGVFLPNLVNVKAVIILVGTDTSINAEKFRYLLPQILVELITEPVYTNMQHRNDAAIRAILKRIVLERKTDLILDFSTGDD